MNANDAISGEKVRGVLKLNWISEDLYGDLEWIPESKRKPYRETGEQMYDNRDVTGATGEEGVTRQIVTYIRTQVDAIGALRHPHRVDLKRNRSELEARLALASRR